MTKDKSSKLDIASDDLVRYGLEINKAMLNRDANRLILAVVTFMEKHDFRSSPEIAAQIPVTHYMQVVSSRDH